MRNQIQEPKVFEAIVRLLRVKMIHAPEWYKILGREDEFWDSSKTFEAKTSSCKFKETEHVLSLIHISEPTRPY